MTLSHHGELYLINPTYNVGYSSMISYLFVNKIDNAVLRTAVCIARLNDTGSEIKKNAIMNLIFNIGLKRTWSCVLYKRNFV